MNEDTNQIGNILKSKFGSYRESDLDCVQHNFISNLTTFSSIHRKLDYDAPLEFTGKYVSRLLDEGKDIMTPSDIQFAMDADSNNCHNSGNVEDNVNPLLKAMTNDNTLMMENDFSDDVFYSDNTARNVNEAKKMILKKSLRRNELVSRSSLDDIRALDNDGNVRSKTLTSINRQVCKKVNPKPKSLSCIDDAYSDLCKKRGFTIVEDDQEEDKSNEESEKACTNLNEWIQQQSTKILHGSVIPEFNRKVDLLKHYACNGRLFIKEHMENPEPINSVYSLAHDPKNSKRSFFKKITSSLKNKKSDKSKANTTMNRSSVSSNSAKKSFLRNRNNSERESSTNLLQSGNFFIRKILNKSVTEYHSTVIVYIYGDQENTFKTDVNYSIEKITLAKVVKRLPIKTKNQRYFFKCIDVENNPVYIEMKNMRAGVPSYNGQICCKVLSS